MVRHEWRQEGVMDGEKVVSGLEIPVRLKDFCSGNSRVRKVGVREGDS